MCKVQAGFSLIEVALVLIIVSLALGGILVPLNAQIQQRRLTETSQLLNEVNEALLGFAASNGRLPCPATVASNGIESPVGGGTCNSVYDGYVPAVTLGLGKQDGYGYLLDAWGNRIRYAVSNSNYNNKSTNTLILSVFTTTSGMKTVLAETGSLDSLVSDLAVCASSTGTTNTSCGTAIKLTSADYNAPPAVIFSLGPNGATGSSSADEAANLDIYPVFVSHTPTPTGSTTGAFDDIVIWLSPNILYGMMTNAGQFQ